MPAGADGCVCGCVCCSRRDPSFTGNDLILLEQQRDRAAASAGERHTARLRAVNASIDELINFRVNRGGLDNAPDLPAAVLGSNEYIDGFNLLEYWLEPERAARYPVIQPLLCKGLVASLASTDVERVS